MIYIQYVYAIRLQSKYHIFIYHIRIYILYMIHIIHIQYEYAMHTNDHKTFL